MGVTVLGLVLLAPAAPVPARPPVAAPKADRAKALEFARIVYSAGDQVAARYAHPVTMQQLITAAVRGLYEECGLTVPPRVALALSSARGAVELVDVLTDVRLLLADQPALRGPRALFAAVNGFRHATEPLCKLASPRANTFASIDMDFGVGIELEGVTGSPWMIYQVEYRTARGQYAPAGWLDQPQRPEEVASPAGSLWRVKRVIPESHAQKAGIRPGDIITHFNGTAVTADNANKLFNQFAFPTHVFNIQTGQAVAPDLALGIKRASAKPFVAKLPSGPYNSTSAFGVMRTAEDKWDCLLDRAYKIGYIRLGAVETDLDTKVGEMLTELDHKGCRALILDLRWCPGGYVDPGVRIAGMFLPNNAVIARMKYRDVQFAGAEGEIRNTFGVTRNTTYPLVVLVGNETTGGGELIAAALRDNGRCVLMGQRTVGRASIQNVIDIGFSGMNFKVTTGESFRPNGKPRMRKPESGPLDEWGLKPDEGLEVPVTKDKSAELRRAAELHSLRPFESTEALDFDDPALDPYRIMALDYLRKKLGKPKGAR
ncbi:MAG TPA: S41 family peptidase [Gemmata sp.]